MCRVAFDLAGHEAAGHVVKMFGLSRADKHVGGHFSKCQRNPRRQTATTTTDHHIAGRDAKRGCLLGDFQPSCALTRDNLRLVVWLDQRQPTLRRNPRTNLVAVLGFAVI